MAKDLRFLGVQLCLLLGIASAAHSASLPALERVTIVATPKLIADFELKDQNGKAQKLTSLRGAPTLVFFGFTHCPAICPAAMSKLKVMHAANDGALKAAHIVFISVDGERDTPAVLKKYLLSFGSGSIGLTGDPRTVSNIAARFSAVAFKEQSEAGGNYGYFHSSQVYLLDKEGRLRATFADASVENMVAVTQLVLDEKNE